MMASRGWSNQSLPTDYCDQVAEAACDVGNTNGVVGQSVRNETRILAGLI
jgi:hypothetical protein